jgi:VWFA-related protein
MWCGVLTLGCLLLPGYVDASLARGQDPGTPVTLKASVSEVNFSFRAADERGRPIEDLELADLDLRDDGRKPVRVMSFQHLTDVPVRAGVLVDTSSSMESLPRHRQVARAYVSGMLRGSSDQAFVMRFDFETRVRQDWTNDAALLNRGIADVARDAGSRMGGTALFDSLYTTCRDKFEEPAASGGAVSNLIVLFSDGNDNRSHTRLKDVLRRCQRTNTAIYAFSDESRPVRDGGQKVLKELAEKSGGRIFYDREGEDVQNLRLMNQDARDRYVVVYKPAQLKPDGSFHTVRLDCPKRTAFLVARRGYYAPEE